MIHWKYSVDNISLYYWYIENISDDSCIWSLELKKYSIFPLPQFEILYISLPWFDKKTNLSRYMKDVKESEAYIGNPVECKWCINCILGSKISWEISWFNMIDCLKWKCDLYMHKFYACHKDLKHYMIQLLCYACLNDRNITWFNYCIFPLFQERSWRQTEMQVDSMVKLYHETIVKTNM